MRNLLLPARVIALSCALPAAISWAQVGPRLAITVADVERLADQVTLARLATTDPDVAVRRAAIRKLTDQALLVRIALTEPDSIDAAVEALTDVTGLAQVATTTGHVGAARKLTPEGLASAADETDDPRLRAVLLGSALIVAAVGEVPAERRDIVRADLLELVPRYADPMWVSRFGALAAAAIEWRQVKRTYLPGPDMEGGEITLRLQFTTRRDRLTARWVPSFPAKAARAAVWAETSIDIEDAYIPWLAGDEVALRLVATTDRDAMVRAAAVRRMTDQAALAVAVTDRHSGVRLAAVQRLTDQGALERVVATESDFSIRAHAVRRLTDPAAIVRVATADADRDMRVVAVRLLTDQSQLEQIAVSEPDVEVRVSAVQRLTDSRVLSRIATSDRDQRVRTAAEWRLKNR